jgi:uncharacterized protein (DUF362 family)
MMPAPNRVAIYRTDRSGDYPSTPPFHPDQRYPEYPFGDHIASEANAAYESVRGALALLGLDERRFDTSEWNPLADIIRPGNKVVIKPNMVRDFHEDRKSGTKALITHASIIRAVVDYVYLACGGTGEVAICDSPQNDADWTGLWNAFRFDELLAFYSAVAPAFKITIYDCRIEAVKKVHGVVVERHKRPEDPNGYFPIDLGDASEFAAVPERFGKLYGAEYDISQTADHHRPGKHEYLVAGSFLAADVIINVPKWKTHKKSGITVWIKSAIGICGDKNWLPHHTEGTPKEGGDQFPADTVKYKTEQRVVAATKKALKRAGKAGSYVGSALRKLGSYVFGDTNKNAIRSGNWHGNDTIWRTTLDLHKCWIYADKQGKLQQSPQRKFLCIVDGIVSGEGNGPLAPTPRHDGIVIAGSDPIAVDTTAATLMGFDPDRLRILVRAPAARGFDLYRVKREEIACSSNEPGWTGAVGDLTNLLDWQPHFGWVGHVEADAKPETIDRR